MKIPLHNLEKGDIFQLRKNGKGYVVHAHASERRRDDSAGFREHYTIAYNNKKLYAFYSDKKIILSERATK